MKIIGFDEINMWIKLEAIKLRYFVIFASSVILIGGFIAYYIMAILGLNDMLRNLTHVFRNIWLRFAIPASIVAIPLYSAGLMILKLFIKEYCWCV